MTATAVLTIPAIRYDDAGQMHETWNPDTAPTIAGVTIAAHRESRGLTFPTLTVETYTTKGYTHVRLTPSQARRLAVAIIEAASTLDLSNDWPDGSRHEPSHR